VLTELQRQIAQVIAGLDEADEFARAGGGALIVRVEIERSTRDLDSFGLSRQAVDQLLPAVEHALEEVGLVVERVQVNPRVCPPDRAGRFGAHSG
jgi:hypothetical protein